MQTQPIRAYLITGVMAAGKSTVAQALAERLAHSAHVRGDLFRRMVVNGAAPATGPDFERALVLRYRQGAMVADNYADAGYVPVVQDVVLGPDLTTYIEAIRTRPLAVVVLAPRRSAVEQRERTRPKTGYGAWTVSDLDDSLRSDTPRIGLWLDTSDQTPEQTVDEILRRTEEARLPDGD